jgi:flagellar assembly protein FliH
MRLFKPVLKPKEVDVQYLVYQPRTFEMSVPEQAVSFARGQEVDGKRRFVINELVAETTKLEELEKKNFQILVEGEVLSRLKKIEENAYSEAYALGMKEGYDKGFEEMTATVKAQVESLKNITDVIINQKIKLVIDNEKHLVETIFHLAKAMALDEIHANPENVLTVITKALENAQSEEEIVLKINPSDATFLEQVKATAGNPFERMNRLRVETLESVTPGGVIVETNYGIVDATIETRIKKVWESITSKIPTPSKGETTK